MQMLENDQFANFPHRLLIEKQKNLSTDREDQEYCH